MRFLSADSLFALAIAFSFIGNFANPCKAILIDDFSIDQAGFSTDQRAEFDYLVRPELLGGERLIFGGGSSFPTACLECEIAATVMGGRFQIAPGADCPGSGIVVWDGAASARGLRLDLSGDIAFQIDIPELAGVAQSMMTVYSGYGVTPSNGRVVQQEVFFNSPGQHLFPFSTFPTGINWQDVNGIAMATTLNVGEFVAFDSVRTVAPEPPAIILALVALTPLARYRRCPRNSRP
jgi:hypothetical protein